MRQFTIILWFWFITYFHAELALNIHVVSKYQFCLKKKEQEQDALLFTELFIYLFVFPWEYTCVYILSDFIHTVNKDQMFLFSSPAADPPSYHRHLTAVQARLWSEVQAEGSG